MNVANLVLDSPVFQWTAKDQIPEADHKNAEELRKQNRQIQNLKRLAYALGVGKIIRGDRKASGENCRAIPLFPRIQASATILE